MNKRALMSVTDKTGIVEFAMDLVSLGWEVVSTGGTAKVLGRTGVPCTPVEDITRFPEMLDGRLKTLHPKVHGGILADRKKPNHMAAIAAHGIFPIDLVVVNLYNFAAKPSIEEIDIGGPTLLRAAAKNGSSVTVVVDPSDYQEVTRQIRELGEVDAMFRTRLAFKVFRATAAYDKMIGDWMEKQLFVHGRDFLQSAATAAH